MSILKKTVYAFIVLCTGLLSAQEEKLFNGINLEGWTAYGTELWYVEDGVLVSESGPDKKSGYLTTNKKYKDFELTFEFKQEKKGNSGIFVRSNIEEANVSGWQIEIAEPGHFTGGVHESFDRGWLKKPSLAQDKALKMGAWNVMRIKVLNNTITTWLNGTEMVSITDEKIEGEGGIVLQIKNADDVKVLWKDFKLTQL